jgi:hypothetical protein
MDQQQQIAELEALTVIYTDSLAKLAGLLASCSQFVTIAITLNGIWEQQQAALQHSQVLANDCLSRLKAGAANDEGEEWKG